MKKILLSLSFLLVLFTGCSEDDGAAGCGAINGLNLTQNADVINVDINSQAQALYFELAYDYAGSQNNNPENMSKITINENNEDIPSAGMAGQDYVFYVRTVCGDGGKGEWFGPKLLSIRDFCNTPKDLSVDYFGFRWTYSPFPGNGSVSNYQVQYGLQGFTLGQGTTATVNTENYDGASMQGGQSYDFYVRAFCSNNVGYGNWAGPFTYFAEENINMCTAPSNIVTHVSSNNGSTVAVYFEFSRNGEQRHEYTIVRRNYDVSEGTVNTLYWLDGWPGYSVNANYNWDFYIRAVCSDGNRTEWVKKEFNP